MGGRAEKQILCSNLYAYAGNNAVNRCDYLGLDCPTGGLLAAGADLLNQWNQRSVTQKAQDIAGLVGMLPIPGLGAVAAGAELGLALANRDWGGAGWAALGVAAGIFGAGAVVKGARVSARGARLAKAGNLWKSRFPGVQVRKIGNNWVKRVNPNSNKFFQAWGQRTINQQAGALSRLRAAGRPAANSRLTGSGRLIVEDVGTPLSRWNYLNPAYHRARDADAKALGGAGRFLNDLRPGNYGEGFRAFDPALDPGVGALGVGGAAAIVGSGWWLLNRDK